MLALDLVRPFLQNCQLAGCMISMLDVRARTRNEKRGGLIHMEPISALELAILLLRRVK
jgi:hypothetical protein